MFTFTTTYWIINSAYAADLSPAVAMSFTSLNIFLVALLFYFLYHEKLTLRLFLGMLVVMVAVALIAMNKSGNSHSDVNLMLAFKPIMFSLIQCIFFTFNTLVTRMLGLRGYNSVRIAIDYLFIFSFFCLAMFFYETFYGEPYTWQ